MLAKNIHQVIDSFPIFPFQGRELPAYLFCNSSLSHSTTDLVSLLPTLCSNHSTTALAL